MKDSQLIQEEIQKIKLLNQEIFRDLLQTNNDLTEMSKEIVEMIEFEYSSTIRSIDVLLDVLKILLSITGSLGIVILTFPRFEGNLGLIFSTFSIEISILAFLLYKRWLITQKSIKRFKEVIMNLLKVKQTKLNYRMKSVEGRLKEVDKRLETTREKLNRVKKKIVV